MARATGKRLAAGLCFIIGAFTIILIPILWPIGYLLYRDAKEAEREREAELEAIEELADKTE